jgi:hypothetical protein
VGGLIVREAGRDDFENLAHLVTELGYSSSTEDMGQRFEEISADPSYATLVAEEEVKRCSAWWGSTGLVHYPQVCRLSRLLL